MSPEPGTSPWTGRTLRAVLPAVIALGLGACASSAPPVAKATVISRSQTVSDTETPSPTTTSLDCPASGLKVTVGETDGALGLRAVGVQLTNCSDQTRRVKGYPTIDLLDEDQQPLDLKVTHGVVGTGIVDLGPKKVVLEPGSTAVAVLTWRNTVTDGDISLGAYAVVAERRGAAKQTVALVVDAGTTGEVKVTAWRAAGEGVA